MQLLIVVTLIGSHEQLTIFGSSTNVNYLQRDPRVTVPQSSSSSRGGEEEEVFN